MKIENIDNPIKVNFQKSNIPIIFLDSNMIIELNKVINNTFFLNLVIFQIYQPSLADIIKYTPVRQQCQHFIVYKIKKFFITFFCYGISLKNLNISILLLITLLTDIEVVCFV